MPEGWLGYGHLRRPRSSSHLEKHTERRGGRAGSTQQAHRESADHSCRAAGTQLDPPIGTEQLPHSNCSPNSLQSQHGCVGTSVTKVWKLLHPPPMEMKPSDPPSLGPLPVYETQRCSDTGDKLGLCMEVCTRFQWFLALAGLCLRYL